MWFCFILSILELGSPALQVTQIGFLRGKISQASTGEISFPTAGIRLRDRDIPN